jgi:cation transport ATPase
MGVAGTDAAIEAAHAALMRDDWRMVPEAIALGRRAFRVIAHDLLPENSAGGLVRPRIWSTSPA